MGNLASSSKDFFDFEYYKRKNPDIVDVFGCDTHSLWKHWCTYGYKECRDHRFLVYLGVAKTCCPPCRKPCQPQTSVKYMSACTPCNYDLTPTLYPCEENIDPCCDPCESKFAKKSNCPTDGFVPSAEVLADALTLTHEDFMIKYGIIIPHEQALATALLTCINPDPQGPQGPQGPQVL
jgi:hypothetical protein